MDWWILRGIWNGSGVLDGCLDQTNTDDWEGNAWIGDGG